MQFEREFIEIQYQNILAGYSPFRFGETVYLAKHISSQDIFEANVHVFSLRDEYKAAGIMTEFECLKDAESKGLWSRDKQNEIGQIERLIKEKQEIQPKLTLPSQVKQVTGQINALIKELNEKLNQKASLTKNSVESSLLASKHDYLAFLCIYSAILERAYKSYNDFLDEKAELADKLIQGYYKSDEINTPVIRCIARTTDARLKIKDYQANPLLISYHFFELQQWCGFYNRVYELQDCPAEHIVADNEKLDGWLKMRRFNAEQANSVKSQEDSKTMTGMISATKEDMEVMGGVSREAALKVS